MQLRALAPSFVALVLAACGGDAKAPAVAPEPAAKASAPAADGGATEGDLYAGFDAGSLGGPSDLTNVTTAAPPPSTDLGAACQKAASTWEKRARPQIKACYREGKKKDPNLMGTARINVDIGFDGKMKPAKLEGTSSLGDDVAKCMVDAVAKTAFPESGECKSRQLTVPIEFPTPTTPH